jgi:hypothetical protein
MSQIPDLPPVLERLLETGDHDLIGAYALDALPAEERVAFEAHLRSCKQCQAELQVLQEAAGILHRAIVPPSPNAVSFPAPPPPAPSTTAGPEPDGRPAPEPEGEERPAPEPVDALPPAAEPATEPLPATGGPEPGAVAIEEPGVVPVEPLPVGEGFDLPAPEPELSAETAAVVEGIAEAPPSRRRLRPRGRVSPGLEPSPEAMAAVAPARPSRLPWLVAAAGALFGIVAIVAALALAETKDNLEEEIAIQNTLIDDLNAQRDAYLQQTTAIVWNLAPTTLGSPDSSGIIFADPVGTSVILSVTGMPALGENQAYQIWYLLPDATSEAGPQLDVDGNGNALTRLTADLTQYQAIAITVEPASGSELPSTDPVLQGFFTNP